MRKKVHLKEKEEEMQLDIIALGNYDDFDLIIELLNKEFDVKVIKKSDGPDMKIWFLKINNISFKLYNDPYGNMLSCSIDGRSIINEIANYFTEYL
jgi:hypothetical protein